MVLLNRAGLVHGSRGPGGGYILARPPETISVKGSDPGIGRTVCQPRCQTQKKERQWRAGDQRLMQAWAKGVAAMEAVLEDTTLADLCKPEQESYMYYI